MSHRLYVGLREGGTLVLFMVRGRAMYKGTFSDRYGIMGINSQFLETSRNYGCPCQGIIHNFQNYGPGFHSICISMALKSTRIYGIMSTDVSGKMAHPRST